MIGARSLAAYTLIELIMAIAIATTMIGLVAPATFDLLASYNLRDTRDNLVSFLTYARDRAVTNLNQSNHGVSITSAQIIVYQGPNAAGATQQSLTYPRPNAVTMTGPADLNFTALTGQTSNAVITLQTGNRILTVTTNAEGTVDW